MRAAAARSWHRRPRCCAWKRSLGRAIERPRVSSHGASSNDCMGNFALSSCAAPVSELVDCVLTVFDSCWPAPHGCMRYLEKPGCSGTLVNSIDLVEGTSTDPGAPLPDCDVRVAGP